MSRLTMERNGSVQNGPSRIPRFDPGNRSMISSNTFSNQQPLPNVGASQRPSRLEQMQFEYQKNMLKHKEDKLISMYEQTTNLTTVNQNKGVVREFFNERKIHSGNKNSMSPTIEQLYQQKKIENQIGPSESFGYRGNGRPMMNNSTYPNYNRGILREKRPSAGRDRGNPLAPIKHINGESENPFTRRKAQIVRPKTYKDVQNRNYPEDVRIPKSAPNGFHTDFNDDESPLPDAKQLQHLQQKRKMLQSQRQTNQMQAAQQNGASMSQAPASRRNPQYEYQTSEEDEGYDEANETGSNTTEGDMKKKQNELLAQIAAQQRELDKLRNERVNAEIEEKKEIERRRKVEDERRKRMVEEEKKKQKEEEEIRMKQQWEEEKQEQIEKEKRRMRHISQNSRASENEKRGNSYNNRYNETRDSPSPPLQSYYEKQPSPTPPPQPRPANTRKVIPKKKQAPKMKPASPLPSGAHTALYDNADQIDGAYENVGRLKQCYNCGRSFAEDRLGKHEQACKNITKKRKVLDTEKLRTKGTDMEQFVAHRQATPPQLKKKNNWRTQHDNFMQAIRYAKKVTQIEKEGGNVADLPPPPPTENPDYVQCPHCTRKFNISAAERHIPHCKNSKARAKPPPQRRR